MFSTLTGFEFVAIAPPPKPKPVMINSARGKKRVIHTASDDEDSEEEVQRKALEAKLSQVGSRVPLHGLLIEKKEVA